VTKTVNFCLPRLGGAESDARILAWKKAPGEPFKADESILEVETDKAVVEVPAPCDGVMGKHLALADALVEFDQALAEISVNDAAAGEAVAATTTAPAAKAAAQASPEKLSKATAVQPANQAAGKPAAKKSGSAAQNPAQASTKGGQAGAAVAPAQSGRRAASPVARKLAAESGVDLSQISGSGPGGRIVLDDVERLAGQRGQPGQSGRTASVRGSQPAVAVSVSEKYLPTPNGEIFARFWNAPAQSGASTTVLVHGLFGDVDTWAGLASSLAGQGQAVVAVDLPAHGKTAASLLTIDKIVSALAHVIATLPPGPKVLVGHSLGGAIVTKLASHPAVRQVSSVALIAPAGLGTEINQSFINGMLNAGSVTVLRRELEKLAVRLPAFGSGFMTDLVESLKERSSTLQELIADFSSAGVQQIDIRAELEQLQMPVSIFWGRQDQIIPWSHALNATPKAALHLIPGVGHMPQWESSNLVLDRLMQLGQLSQLD
jgi:pyruvate/2-oxoglutarate dehydrogenase complex dihydrolipoamide acyltransferase (E2) component